MRISKVQYNTQGQKRCSKCSTFKDTSEFHKWSKGQDGLKLQCKSCVRNYDQLEDDPKRKMPRKVNENGQINCRNCGGYFDESEMRDLKKNAKTQTYCQSCYPIVYRMRLVAKYGITNEQYEDMLEQQNYSCKICGGKETTFRKRLSIDHDHSCCAGEGSCGKCIRGLLCHHCNAALGNVRDNIQTLQSMIGYLQQSPPQKP